MKLRKTIARNVVMIRTEKGLSKSDFAKRLRMDPSILTKIESGTANLTADTIERLSKGLGVSASRLTATKDETDLSAGKNMLDVSVETAKELVQILEALQRFENQSD